MRSEATTARKMKQEEKGTHREHNIEEEKVLLVGQRKFVLIKLVFHYDLLRWKKLTNFDSIQII